MFQPGSEKPDRYIGLDIHKHYMVSAGVDEDHRQVLPFRTTSWEHLDGWIERTLTPRDAVVLEMTTNTWEVYDRIVDKVHSVTVVHPPHVKLIVKAPVMNDKKAALILANELADDRFKSIWVPPQQVRDLRMLIAERWKMIQMLTKAKNRLHSVLHRHHLPRPEGSLPFHPKHKEFWLNLAVTPTEKVAVQLAWSTIEFAEAQKAMLEQAITDSAATDERVPLLIQLPGVGVIIAMTILAAIGEIERFPNSKHLVGYAGLGAKVHDSGESYRTGGITKRGRKDLRAAMVIAAQGAVKSSPYWKAQYERLSPRLGKKKARVAIARRLLVAVWHVLTYGEADRHADTLNVARSLFGLAYDLGSHNRPKGQSALAFTRYYLDKLKLGRELTHLPWGRKNYQLPPTTLTG